MNKIEALKNLKVQPLVAVDQNHHNQQEAVKFTTARVNQIEKFIKESLNQDSEYFAGEKKTLQNVIVTLQDQTNKLEHGLSTNREQKQQIENDLAISKQEINRLQNIIPPHDATQLQNEIQEIKKQIVGCNKMRLDEANGLNINDLKQLQIKNKDKESPVNELWIWTLVVIYKEPASSYYWINFKEQVLEKAEGAQDFKERLGKVKAIDMKKDEYERTQNLVRQKEKIINSEILTPLVKTQIQNIFKIVDLMLQVEEHGNKIHGNEKLLQQLAQQKIQIEADTQKNQERCKILQDRINFLEIIYNGYVFMQEALKKKITSYQKAQVLNDEFTSKIESSYNHLDFTKTYDQKYVPPQQEVFEEPKQEILIEQQQQQQQVLVDEEANKVEKASVLEVQQTPDQAQLNQEPPQTVITQEKTGGCEACKIF